MARPTDFPRWANGAGADITEPPESKKDTGWNVNREKPSRRHLNWLLRVIYLWLFYLDEEGATPFYDSVLSALSALETGSLAVGDVVVVGNSTDLEPWSRTWSADSGSNVATSCCDGGLLAVGCASGLVRAYNAFSGSVQWSQTLVASPVLGICTDGNEVFWSYGNTTIYRYDGTSLDTLAVTGGNAQALATDGVYLYVCLSNGDVKAYDLATEAEQWHNTDLNGETLNDIATDGRYVAIALDYAGGGAAKSVAFVGADDGVLTHSIAVNAGAGPDDGTAVAFDEHGVCYLGSATGATGNVWLLAPVASPLLSPPPTLTASFTGAVIDLDVCRRYIAVAYGSDRVLVWPRTKPGADVYAHVQTTVVSGGYVTVAADDDHVFAAGLVLTDHANGRVQALAQPSRPKLMRLPPADDRYRAPLYGRIVPVE